MNRVIRKPIKIKAVVPLSVGDKRHERGEEFSAPFSIAHLLCRSGRATYVNEADAKSDPGPQRSGCRCGPSKNKIFGPDDFKGGRNQRVSRVNNPNYHG